MAENTQPLEVTNFNGGIIDYHINAPINRYLKADNLLIVKYGDIGKLFTRPGSKIYDPVNYQIPAGAQRVGTIKFFNQDLLVHSARKIYFFNPNWQELVGPTGNSVFPTGTTVDHVTSYGQWNDHFFIGNSNFAKVQKIFRDETNVLRLLTAGLPKLASAPTITPFSDTGKSFIYRFYYDHRYTVGNREFQDVGPTLEVFVDHANDPGLLTPISISNVPVLANGADDNYDVSSTLKIAVFRTTNQGTVFYRIGDINNGMTSLSDPVTDADLQNGLLLYTEGGIPDNDPPPKCKTMCIVQQWAFYGHVMEGTRVLKNRVVQSKASDPDSVPARFFVDLADEVVAVSSFKDTPLALCVKTVYRLDGVYNEDGSGGLIPQLISNTATCISEQSVVQTLDGTFWFGADGVYWTDAFQVKKVNKDWNQTYAQLVSLVSKPNAQVRVQGKHDTVNRRIYWTVQQDATNPDCDACYVLDLNWGVSDAMPFTSISGFGNTSFSPTAIEFDDRGNMIRGDRRGYMFQHLPNIYDDPRIVVGTNPSTWATHTIRYDYRSVAFNFGTDQVRKLVPRVTVMCKNETNLSLQIVSNNDDNRRVANCAAIRFTGNITWGDPDVIWGDPNLIWNQDGLINDWRHFPSSSLRCSLKQIYLQNAFVAIVNSDLLGQATVDAVLKTATLVNLSSLDWPTKAMDYSLAFSNDGYINEYVITDRTDDVLTFLDSRGVAPSGVQSWVIRGYPKGEIINLLSYVLHFIPFGRTQHAYQSSESGEVGSAGVE